VRKTRKQGVKHGPGTGIGHPLVQAIARRIEGQRLAQQARREGYGPAHLEKLFGVRREKVKGWVEKGLFGNRTYAGLCVPEEDVLRFLLQNGNEYSMSPVHQDWIRVLVFGSGVRG
jgi:hypothetical protein